MHKLSLISLEKILKLVNVWLFSKVYSSSQRGYPVGFMKSLLNGKKNVRKYLLNKQLYI